MDHVAFVRAIMHGRGGYVAADVERVMAEAGAEDVRSHHATGNLTFRGDPDVAERAVAAAEMLLAGIDGDHPVFLRSADELGPLVEPATWSSNPWPDAARGVTFLADPVPTTLTLPMASPSHQDWVVFAAHGRDLLVAHRQGGPGAAIERAVGALATSRAISTVELVLRRLGR